MQGVQPLLRRYWTWRAISWSERGGRKEKVSKNLEKESEGKGASRSVQLTGFSRRAFFGVRKRAAKPQCGTFLSRRKESAGRDGQTSAGGR